MSENEEQQSPETEQPQTPEEDVLDISLDAEEELPPVPVAPPLAGTGEVLSIDSSDLLDMPDLAGIPTAAGPKSYPSISDIPTGDGKYLPMKKQQFLSPVVTSLLAMVLAGAIGGFAAWLFAEPFINDQAPNTGPETRTLLATLATMGLFGACIGGMVGLALGSVEGILSRVWEKAGMGALLGLGIGAAGGFLGGVFGQALYGGLGGGQSGGMQIAIRGAGWAVVGLFVGLGQGVMMRSSRKVVNGLIGGCAGGLLGGLLFDPISAMIAAAASLTGGTVGGEVSRLVAMAVMGAACGAAISLVEQARKEAWLRVVSGPLAGKEFIIYRSPTLIGSSPKCDITLALDKQVAPQHVSITQEGSRYLLSDMGSATGTRVNGRPTQMHNLRSGDQIAIGQTVLEYSDRAVSDLPGVPR